MSENITSGGVTGEEGEGMGEISVDIEGDSSGDRKASREHWGHLRPAAAGALGFALWGEGGIVLELFSDPQESGFFLGKQQGRFLPSWGGRGQAVEGEVGREEAGAPSSASVISALSLSK